MQHQMQPMQGAQTQQSNSQAVQGSQQSGQRLQDVESPQQRAAINATARAIQVCEWCADQCVQEANPSMVECIRLCEDVSELGRTTLSLVPRNSRHTQQHLQTFQQALQACAQECSQHQQAHCQECAQVLSQATESIQQYVASTGQQQGQYSQQMAGF